MRQVSSFRFQVSSLKTPISAIVSCMLQAGDLMIHFLNDGFWWDDGGAQFGIVPRELWEKEKSANARHRIKLSLTCPLIVTGSALVLVDTGIGNRLSEREQAIYTPERGEGLRGNLRALGFAPEDVTHVILSHLHFDHVGGVIEKSANGEIRPMFTNARIYMQKSEWELAMTPPDERLAAAYRHASECLRPLEKVELINGDTTITPEIRTAISGGHTSPHQCIIVESGGTGLIHLADIVPTTSHLRLAWNAAYDTDPLTTVAAKKRFFAEARTKNLWISFSHDDKVAAGLLAQEDGKTTRLAETISGAQ
jgi:glyoxylase-like metal-dependent hydrolase (beta-lactamase superfamily II)